MSTTTQIREELLRRAESMRNMAHGVRLGAKFVEQGQEAEIKEAERLEIEALRLEAAAGIREARKLLVDAGLLRQAEAA